MRRTRWLCCFSRLYPLLLGLLLSFSTLAFSGNAYAQVARTTRISRARISNAQEMQAAAFYDNLVRYTRGKVILVSLSHEWMYVYENSQEIFDTPVTTGRPQLPTPTGVYHVFRKRSPATFLAPYPRKSPYWYPPAHVNYALEWRAGGYYIHDAWWHTSYGPGTSGWHDDPSYGWQWGSHGCIAVPLDVAAWLYSWASYGTTVRVVR